MHTIRTYEQATRRIAKELADGDGGAARAFEALDTLKRETDELLAPLYKNVRRTGDLNASRTIEFLAEKQKPLRAFLEDVEVWGDAGAFQKELNNALSGGMAAIRESDSLVARMFRGDATQIDPAHALSIVRRYGKGLKGERMGGDLERILARQEDVFDVASKYLDIGDDGAKKIAEAREIRKQVTAALEERAEIAAYADDWSKIRSAEGADSVSIGMLSNTGATLGAGIGGAIGGLPGATIGTAVGSAVTRPYTMLRGLAGLQELAERMNLNTAGAVDRFLGGKGASVGSGTLPGVVSWDTPARAAKLAGAQAVAKREKPEDRYERILDNAPLLAMDPSVLARRMDDQLFAVRDVAPGLAGAMPQKVQAAAAFLQGKIPPSFEPPLGGPRLVDPVARARFLRYVDAIEDPAGTLDRLADGTLTAEHTEALRAVYPEIYYDAQRQIMDRLGQRIVDGDPVPFDKRVQIGILFDAPTDAALQPEAQALIQGQHGSDGGEQQAMPRPRTRSAAASRIGFADRRKPQSARSAEGLES